MNRWVHARLGSSRPTDQRLDRSRTGGDLRGLFGSWRLAFVTVVVPTFVSRHDFVADIGECFEVSGALCFGDST